MLISIPAWCRGGGGCFEKGTLISTSKGLRSIENLKIGDHVYSRSKNHRQLATIVSTTQIIPNQYMVIKIPKHELHVTKEHLIATKLGVYRKATSLTTNDRIMTWQNDQWQSVKIIKISHIKSRIPAYNLLVDSGSTYIANNILVHNKGCFLPSTPILRSDGTSIAISAIKIGDQVKAYEPNEKIISSTVRHILKHQVKSYYILTTDKIILHVTAEHPFYVGHDTFKTVETLRIGDVIYGYDGKQLTKQSIINIKKIKKLTTVYNLQTDEPHTYFASGIAVHNKGGGGGHGGGHSCAQNDEACQKRVRVSFLFGMILIIIYIIYAIKNRSQDLDYLNSRSNIERKSKKTMKLIRFLARQDSNMNPDYLTQRAREIFLKLQDCWISRNYDPMIDLMMPDIYKQHCRQIQSMIQNHEINKLRGLRLDYIDLVNVRYTEKEYQREFTALITAAVADYYVDDRNNKFLRGNKSLESFQEFWTFELEPDGWRLRDIEQARESDYLKEENYAEMFTDLQIEKIYDDRIDDLGTQGPWLPKAVAQKENKVDRMLNFLSKSNKMWDRQSMITRVRTVFTQVHLSLEAGKLYDDTRNMLFPKMAEQIQNTLDNWRTSGNTIEYRNFCIRKVEIVLVESFDDKSKNEFTARISAHAQIIHCTNGEIISKDTDVTLFIEYWEFGQLDNEWKLKSAKLKDEKDIINAENTEEGSSPELIKWYYTKKRA